MVNTIVCLSNNEERRDWKQADDAGRDISTAAAGVTLTPPTMQPPPPLLLLLTKNHANTR